MEIEHADRDEWDDDKFLSIPEHKTNILPLRWFGNACNVYPASWALERAIHLEHSARTDLPLPKSVRMWWKLYEIFDAPYRKWGTSYRIIWGDDDEINMQDV